MIEKISFAPRMVVAPVSPKEIESLAATDVTKSFGAFLNDALGSVQNAQNVTDQLNDKFIVGEIADVHQLTIAAEKAALGLELTVQIRNKMIEAYQEIMRTQI